MESLVVYNNDGDHRKLKFLLEISHIISKLCNENVLNQGGKDISAIGYFESTTKASSKARR